MTPRGEIVRRSLLVAGLALVLLSSGRFVEGGAGDRWAVGVLTLVVCGALLLVDTDRGRPPLDVRPPVPAVALVVLAVAGVVACWLLPGGGSPAVPLVVARLAAQPRVPRWLRRSLLVVATVALLLYSALEHAPWWTYVGWPLAVGVVLQSGLRVQSRRQQLEDAELLLAQEQALREEQVRAAAATERNRIARELHDVLAHTLSGLTVTLQATAVLLDAEGASTAAREQVGRARALAVDGLAEARTAVASLATTDDGDARLDLRAVVGRQVREHRVTTGAAADLEVVRLPDAVAPTVVAAVSGILREALTNAVRHAPARPVRVVLDVLDGRLVVLVEVDEGRRAPDGGPGGMGVTGMAQRAAEIGGRLEAGPYAQGWRVRAVLPPEAEDGARG